MKLSEEQKQRCIIAEVRAKEVLKKGDRVSVTLCPGTKRTITFSHWDGPWMVSKSGKDDYHPVNIYMVNGTYIRFYDRTTDPGKEN